MHFRSNFISLLSKSPPLNLLKIVPNRSQFDTYVPKNLVLLNNEKQFLDWFLFKLISHFQIFSPQSRISQQYWIMTYCMFTILQIHVIVSYKINYNRWIKWAAASNSIENIVCWWWFCTIYIFTTPFALDVTS